MEANLSMHFGRLWRGIWAAKGTPPIVRDLRWRLCAGHRERIFRIFRKEGLSRLAAGLRPGAAYLRALPRISATVLDEAQENSVSSLVEEVCVSAIERIFRIPPTIIQNRVLGGRLVAS